MAAGREAPRKTIQLTAQVVEGWLKSAAEQQSLHALRHLMKAYRLATHYGEGAGSEGGAEQFEIASSSSFNRLMISVLQQADTIFRRMLKVEGKQKLAPADLKKAERWRNVEPLLKAYIGNTLHVLGQVTDSNLVTFVLRRLRPSAALLAPFQKLTRKILKASASSFSFTARTLASQNGARRDLLPLSF